jgi:hypothetical protein
MSVRDTSDSLPRARDITREQSLVLTPTALALENSGVLVHVALGEITERQFVLLLGMGPVGVFATRHGGTGFHGLLPGLRYVEVRPAPEGEAPRPALDARLEDPRLGPAYRDAHAQPTHDLVANEVLLAPVRRCWGALNCILRQTHLVGLPLFTIDVQ